MAAKKSKTLENTKKRGFVRCGVSQGLPGFSNADVIFFIIDSTENWSEQSEEHFQALIALKKGIFYLFIQRQIYSKVK